MAPATLTPAQSRFAAEARRATLATRSPSGRPRPMPVCYVLVSGAAGPPRLYTPVDEKPKRSGDPRRLARIRDIAARPEVAVLVDRWEEDWSRLAWLRLEGAASVLWPADSADVPTPRPISAPADNAGAEVDERRTAIELLRARYPQYADHDLESRPLIRIVVTRVVAWGAIDGA